MKTVHSMLLICLLILSLGSTVTPLVLVTASDSSACARSPPIVMGYSPTAGSAHQISMPKQVDIFNGSFTPSDLTLAPNQVVDVSFSICVGVDVPDATIQFLMPGDFVKLVKGELVWIGSVKKDQPLSLQLSIIPEGEVETGVVAKVSAGPQGETYSSSYYLHVSSLGPKNVGGTGGSLRQTRAPLTLSTPAKTPPPTTPPAPPNDAQVATTSPTSASPQSTGGTIEIKGRFGYLNDYGGWSDARYMEVVLFDQNDISWNAAQWTDGNGRYDFIVGNSASGRSPWVALVSQGEWHWIVTDSSGNQYWWSTGVCGHNVPDGFFWDYGAMRPTSSQEALQAGDAVYTEALFVWISTNWARSKVTIVWPYGDWPKSDGDTIYLSAKSTAFWDHVDVEHEYGHCIMWALYGNNWPPSDYIGDMHSIIDEKDGGFAICEGWADFMPCAAENDPNNLRGGARGGNIETNDWYNWRDAGDMDGNIIEGSCASILWDIFDPINATENDYLSRGFADIFWIMHDYKPGDMVAFWSDWINRYPDLSSSQGPLSSIYWNYGIDEDWYAPWGSITINLGALYTSGRWVTVTLHGYDWGSGVYRVRFSEDGGVTWGPWHGAQPPFTWFDFYLSTSGDGYKRVDAQFADADWRTSAAGTIYDGIGLDTAPPVTTINHDQGRSSVSLSATDANSGVQDTYYRIDGGSWIIYSGAFTLTGTGTHTIDCYSNDNVGNQENTETLIVYYLTVKTDPSGIIITDIYGTGWYDKGVHFVAGAPPHVSYNGITYRFWTWRKDGIPVAGNVIIVIMDMPHEVVAVYLNLHMESIQDTGTTSDLGTIALNGTSYILPNDECNPAGYQAKYTAASSTYSFDHWETSGEISVSSKYGNPTTMTVSGAGTLRAVYKTTVFSDGFESGNFSAWTGKSVSAGETATVVSTLKHHGTYSAKLTSNGTGGTEYAYCYKTISASSELYARAYFYVSQSGIVDENDRLYCIILAASTDVAYAGWRKTGGVVKWTLVMKNGTSTVSAYSSWSPSLNKWYCVELHWKQSSTGGWGELFVNGVRVCSLTGMNTTAYGSVTKARFGLPSIYYCGSTTVYCDCAKIGKKYIGPEYVFSNGFESGSFNAWTGKGNSAGETATVTNSIAHDGNHSAKLTSNGTGGFEYASCYKSVSPLSEVYARGYFRVATSGMVEDGDRISFIAFANASGYYAAYAGWYKTGGVVKWYLMLGSTIVYSTASPSLNKWYCVELHWKKGITTGLGELYVNGVKVCSITAANTAPYVSVTQTIFGLALLNCGSATAYCDCAKIAVNYIGQEY